MSFMRFCALLTASVCVSGCGGGASGNGGPGGGSGAPTEITFTITGATPTAVATQVGSGSFTAATLTSGQLTLSLPNGTTDFAVAYACPAISPFSSFTQSQEYLEYGSSLDRTAYSGFCISDETSGPGGGTTPTATLTGDVDIGPFSQASELFVWALAATSGFGESFNLTQSDNFSLSSAPSGTDNVVLSLYDSSRNALAVRSLSNQAVPGAVNGGSPVDFGAGDATTFQPITYANVPTGYSISSTDVNVVSAGLKALVQMNSGLGIDFGNQGPLAQYSMLPSGIAQSGDQYQLESTASKRSSAATSVVSFSANLIGGGPATVTFPAPWSYAGPTPAALPTVDFSYRGLTGQSGLTYSASLRWTPASSIDNAINISLTPNYQSVSPSVTVPDLSAITGFLAAPSSGTTVFWSAEIGSGFAGLVTSGGLGLASSSGSSNASHLGVSSSGLYTVP